MSRSEWFQLFCDTQRDLRGMIPLFSSRSYLDERNVRSSWSSGNVVAKQEIESTKVRAGSICLSGIRASYIDRYVSIARTSGLKQISSACAIFQILRDYIGWFRRSTEARRTGSTELALINVCSMRSIWRGILQIRTILLYTWTSEAVHSGQQRYNSHVRRKMIF